MSFQRDLEIPMATGRGNDARHALLLDRLRKFLEALATNAPLRRALITDPSAALCGYFILAGDDTLPLSTSYQKQPLYFPNAGQCFGLSESTTSCDLPLELRLMVYGVRDCARIVGSEFALVGWLKWAEANGYTALLSAFEWDRPTELGKGNYVNICGPSRNALPGSNSQRCLFVAQTVDTALLLWVSDLLGWDTLTGQLLGYPTCCVRSYKDRWIEAQERHQGDVAALVLRDSGLGPHPWRHNLFGRYFGVSMIEHFPCQFDCSDTANYLLSVEAALLLFEPRYLAACRNLMTSHVVYAEEQGVVLLPEESKISGDKHDFRLDYDPELIRLTAPSSELACALRTETSAHFASQGSRITVGKKSFDVIFGTFSKDAKRSAMGINMGAASKSSSHSQISVE